MESKSADDAAEAVRGSTLIFMSDASAEGERLTSALHARGYVVADVPLALLAGRVAVQRPALVLCDADAEGCADVLGRIREAEAEAPIPVLVLGDRNGTIAGLGAGLVAGVFARPVNVQELLGTVDRLVRRSVPSTAPSRPPPSRVGTTLVASSRPPSRASVSPVSRPPERSRTDATGPAPQVLPLPPDLGEISVPVRDSGDAPTVELSADIQQLLEDAELRFERTHPTPGSEPEDLGPEIEAEVSLPPDVIAALSEPLDDEDPGAEGTPMPSQDGTGALTSSKGVVRGHTQIGAGGSTFSGTASAPLSEVSVVSGTGLERTNSGAASPIDDDEARRARQMASTPKPPKPAEGDGSVVPEPSRGTLPPPTVAQEELPLPSGQSPSARPQVARAAEKPLAPERGRVALDFDSNPPERNDLTSTTPPLRRRDEVWMPGLQAGTPPLSPAAAAPETHARENERPARPRTDPPEKAGPHLAAPRDAPFNVPPALRPGDSVTVVAAAIRARYTGALAFEVDEGIRRIVFRDGDFVTLTSGVHGESLVAFLAGRGDLPTEVARQGHKFSAFGRRAGAALIAHGHLAQDQLWPVLRAHAEWLIGRVLGIERGNAGIEEVGRLEDEPAVFGGATGAEVLIEVGRRIVSPEDAVERLGGLSAELGQGPSRTLLAECALSALESERVQNVTGKTVRECLEVGADPSFVSVLYVLTALNVLRADAARARAAMVAAARSPAPDDIDDDALRGRVLARKALVDEGDYFAVLGVARSATGYDIRRAYTTLRRDLEPSRMLTARTADLAETVDEIISVLEEAYQILSDQRRRERYLRAIEASP